MNQPMHPGAPVDDKTSGISLSTQLSVLLMFLAFLTFAATVLVSAGNMRDYLNAQLSRAAQDTANSLGLSISPYISGDDQTMADTMVSAIFDSGYYLSIKFVDAKNQTKFERRNPVQSEDVPSWFIHLFSLEPPVMSSEVNDGWKIAGTLSVQSHPGYAYRSLWQHTKGVFWTSLLLCGVALLAVHALLLVVLKPLKDIEKQAQQLAEKRFEFLNHMPMTKELRTVVRALNNMVGNVKRSFIELTDRAEQLNQQVYVDSLTGLPNRRALVQSFTALADEPELDGNSVYLGLVALRSLKYVNDQQGYSAGDAYVEKAASILNAQIAHLQQGQIFRISGSEFVLLARLGHTSAQQFDLTLRQALEIASSEHYPDGFASLALQQWQPGDELSTALMKLDSQSMRQQFQSTPTAQLEPVVIAKSRSDWQEILHNFTRTVVSDTSAGFADTSLEMSKDSHNMFRLEVQPVYQADQVLYLETFVKFRADGEELASSDVFAMAERLGVSLLLDKALVTFILGQLKGQKAYKFGINLSKSAVHDNQFRRWLANAIRAHQADLPQLVFEVNEQAILGALASATEFFNGIKQLGAQSTIERFGASFTSFRYLQGLNVDYIKIDGSYIRALEQKDTRFFVETMTQICHGIGIRVIAAHIENQQIAAVCREIHVDAMQGHGLYSPIPFFNIEQKSDCLFTMNRV